MFKKIIRYTILLAVLLFLLCLHFYIPRFITEIQNPVVKAVKSEYLITHQPGFGQDGNKVKHIEYHSFDDSYQNAVLSYTDSQPAKGTIILLHGIRSYKEHFIELSEKINQQGYNAVAVDLRAHGSSQGQHCTFGVNEKIDAQYLLDALAKENITDNIGIWGQSLGGAVAIQALAHDERLAFGIIESTFSDFGTITNDYFSYHAGFNIETLTNYLVDRAGDMAEFKPEDSRPREACKKITQPTLMVHGNQDKRIDIKYGRENFANLNSEKKEFLEIDQATHLNVWKVGGEEYFEKVFDFIESTRS